MGRESWLPQVMGEEERGRGTRRKVKLAEMLWRRWPLGVAAVADSNATINC